ncbi:hypothetical protein J2T12_001395 [Paenibacillus anaericanus]|uniref:hypothetical protein n=1 Tax=Paenibacillus anaericanus TaxID=170367 RepID=UPI0027814BA1|nr:hypothetical protein [Paenibacillus anaericanus]MDQ0087989.1 hypothetical protein [Paenibacillus anaericanus]
MGLHITGFLVALFILLPNVLFAFLPPQNTPNYLHTSPIIFTILEQVGRIACLTLPIVFGKKIAEQDINFMTVLMGICLLIYYLCWIYFFIKGREYDQLFKPLGFIPIPMAVFPALYFIFLGIWLHSFIFLVPALLFAIGHLVSSWNIYTQLK